jgi:predicted ATPase/DNA-binding CsgD family transcriptional regulator
MRPASPPTNLPAELSSFVGRKAEVHELQRMLRERRLLTLVGPGGIGKTRLAERLAQSVLQDYPDGVFLVELESVAEPELVPDAVAQAIGVRPTAGIPASLALARALPGQWLLVLDGCAHVREASARFTLDLMDSCPGANVLATSLQPLAIPGETTWRVPSLAVPELSDLPTADVVATFPAIRLFVERARAVRPDFALTAHNAHVVADICAHLDGVPLALELAAAQVDVLDLDTIARQLHGDRLDLLRGSRAGPSRHRTLRANANWSYELLSEPERVLFCRLSVFAQPFTLEAAQAVCGGDGLDADAIEDLLDQLVERSLVASALSEDGRLRYRLLAPLRWHAREQLPVSAEAERLRQRHVAYYPPVVETSAPSQDEARSALARLDAVAIVFEERSHPPFKSDRLSCASRGRRGSPPSTELPLGELAIQPPTENKLSPREREVAMLLRHGLTNRQIGDALVVSERTVAAHISNAFAKLDLQSRTQLALWTIGRSVSADQLAPAR